MDNECESRESAERAMGDLVGVVILPASAALVLAAALLWLVFH